MRRDRMRLLTVCVSIGLVLGLGGGVAYALFFSTTSNGANSFSTGPDWTPPSASASVIQRTPSGYLAGSIRPSGAYLVYAAVTDSGNPAAGVASVQADVSAITAGQTAVPLSAGSWTVAGIAYNYRSASLTADAGLTAGTKTYTLTLRDAATPANSGTQSFTVIVDATAPTGVDVQTANGGSTVGKPETGDTITYTFSEQMDPGSILSGWTGSSTSVTVRLLNGGGGNDTVQIWDAGDTVRAALGSINLGRTDYVAASRTFTNSTMTQSGATIAVTLGAPSGLTFTAGGAGTMQWTPTAQATDPAGNACANAPVAESGAADTEF